MARDLLLCCVRLLADYRRARAALALEAGGVAALTLLLAQRSFWSAALVGILPLLVVYGGSRIRSALRYRRALRQLRLEARFLRFASDDPDFDRCLYADPVPRVWAQSALLSVLRRPPMPAQRGTDPSERAAGPLAARSLYEEGPRHGRIDVGLLAVLCAGLYLQALRFLPANLPLVLLSLVALGLVGGVAWWRRQLARSVSEQLRVLREGVVAWADLLDDAPAPAARARPYAAVTVYQARSWFGPRLQPAPDHPPLQTVARRSPLPDTESRPG